MRSRRTNARGALRYGLALALLSLLSREIQAQSPPTETFTFAPVADTYVDAGSATKNFDTATTLTADASPVRISYLRFAVTGLNGRPVQQAKLRLGVAAKSSNGGTVHRISNNVWNAATVTYSTRPALDGAGLATLGTVATAAVVEFDLGTAVSSDGTYSFAIDSTSSAAVSYNSTSAKSGQKPTLVLTVVATPPQVTIAQPPDAATFYVGDSITLQGSATDSDGVTLSSSLVWRSSLAGNLGTGAVVNTTLPQGRHTITASVTDGRGLSGTRQIGLTVTPRPPANTPPLVTITAPGNGQAVAAGVPLRFVGGASDLEDGPLGAALAWTSDRDGPLGTGASVTRALDLGTHQITASVTDAGGLRGAATVTVPVEPAGRRELPAVADASVDGAEPEANFGTSPLLGAGGAPPHITYLRFVVSGLGGRTPTQVLLRLQVDDTPGAESDDGGTVYATRETGWQEDTITYAGRPPLAGSGLASAGAVTRGQTVDLDLTDTVSGEGTYDFALVSGSGDQVLYRARESGVAPRLVLTLPDNPPLVAITAPAAQTLVFRGAPLTFRATAADVEDGDLGAHVEWRSSLDGPLDGGASITTSALAVGTHTITAAATDADGLGGEASLAIRVRPPNLAPVVAITAPADGLSVPAGSSVTLAASALDDFDGALSSQLHWTSSRDGTLGTGASLATSRLSVGTHVLTAAVTDSDGAVGSAQVGLAIAPTTPTVTIAAPLAGTRVFVGTAVTFTGSASDAGDGDVSARIRWLSDREGLIGSGATLTSTRLGVGTHTITAVATDSYGLTGLASVSLVVRPPNVPPTVTVVAPANGMALVAGRPLLLGANATDVEDGDLGAAVRWTSSRDGALGTGSPLVVAALSIGTHTLTAAVSDHDGAPGNAAITVTVVPATLSFASIADTYVDSGSAAKTFGATTSMLAGASPDRQAFLRFAVSGVGHLTVGRALLHLTVGSSSSDGSTAGGTVRALGSGTWSEAATTYNSRPVVDGAVLATAGAVVAKQAVDFDVTSGVTADGTYNFALVSSASDWVRYTSREASSGQPALVVTLTQDQSPWLRITAPATGTRILPGTPLTFSATATDAESGDLSAQIAWRSDRDGALGIGTTVVVSTLTPGRHTVTAQVTDGGGHSGQAQITVDVAHPPAVTITAPAGGTAVFASALPLTLTGRATDVEDGDLSTQLEWRSDRDGPLATGAVVTASALSVGTHTITASVRDDDGLAAAARITLRVRAPNLAPVVTVTAPADGSTVLAGTAVTLAGTAGDDFDGDLGGQLRWTSSRDGALGTGPLRTVTLSEGAHVLTAAVTDSDGVTTATLVRLTVAPTPPVATIATPPAATTVFVGTAVTFSGSASDATDGNLTASLHWTSSRDGLIGTGAGFTTTRLGAGTHVITAAATDRGGLVGQATRTVVVRPPNVPPTVSITAPAAATSLLVGHPVLLGASATDAEDGDLGAAVRWTSSRDGALGTGSPLVVSTLSPGTHTLTAAITDRDGAPASATVSVTVVPATLTFTPIADTYVDQASAGTKFGTATSLLVGATPSRQAFLRFAVSGIAPFAVQQALLRLTVGSGSSDGSAAGGSVHALGATTWSETTTTYNSRPPITGVALATRAKVVPKQAVDLDVSGAVRADGTYNLALDSTSTDSVKYASREASAGKPQLIVTLAQDTAPLLRVTAPVSGTAVGTGIVVDLVATATDAEGGDLSNRIVWRSDRDGQLGTAGTLRVSSLSPGAHTLTAEVTDDGGHTVHASVALIVDAPPAITITAPLGTVNTVPGVTVALQATARDPEDGDLTAAIAWSSDSDGPLGTGGAVFVSSLPSGTHTITATVTDGRGQRARTQATVVVNAVPSVTISTPADRSAFLPAEPVALAATATDTEDGDLAAAIAWSSDLDGALGTGPALTVRTLRSGTHTITASAIDSGGKRGSAHTTVVVNAAPAVTITAPADGTVVTTGEGLHLAGVASDVEDGSLTAGITWTSSLDGPLGAGGTLVPTLRAGTHTITASVTDAGGLRASARITVVVNVAPTLSIIAPADGTVTSPGEPVTLSATARDAEDGDLGPVVAWSSNLDGPLGIGPTVAVATLRSGTHTITATVTDARGKTSTAHVTLVVNAAPAIAITAPADGTVFTPGDTVPLAATATDAEEGDLGTSISWSSNFDGPLGAGRSLPVSTLRPGTHRVTASVTDSGGKASSAQITLVVDAVPRVTITAPRDGAEFVPGEPVLLTASATDTEDGDLGTTITWTSDLDGPLGTGSPFSTAGLRSGTHVLTASVSDSHGKGASDRITVVVNAPPTVTITAPADGYAAVPGEEIVFTASAADAEEGDLSTTISWASNLDGTLGTGGTLHVDRLRSGTHTITASVTDGGGRTATEHVSVIVNAPPTLAITAPAGGSLVAPGDLVTLAATANDPEDGPLDAAVAWTSDLDGPLGTGGTLPVTTLRSGTHGLTASVTDRGGRTASAQVTLVVNAPPTVAVTAPADGTVSVPGDEVILTGTATDAEDGDLGDTIAWASNLDGALGVGRSLGVSTLRSGTHLITASVTDSSGRTAHGSVTVVVNAGPTITIAAPADGTLSAPGDALVFSGAAVDAEDGDLGATIAWTSSLDGFLGTGSPLAVSTLSSGTHQITARVIDAGGKSAAASVGVVIDAAPSVVLTAPLDGLTASPGDPVTMVATASDAEDGDLGAAVAWASDLDGPLGVGRSLVVTTLRSGTHTLTATVADAAGRTATTQVTVIVNAPPALAITAPADGSVTAPGGIVTLTGTAADAEDGDLGAAITWRSNLDGLLGTGATLDVATLRSGTHTVTASVTDHGGQSTSAAITLVVAPLITLTGTYATAYNNLVLAPQTWIDARSATFLAGPGNLYPVNLGGDDGVHLVGGSLLGQFDRNWSWDQMHGLNNAGVAFTNAELTVDGLRIDNVTDGVRPRSGGMFTIRNTWISYARDDCVEDDHLQDGLIDDSLFDGCYVAISSRPSPAIIASGYDGRGKVLTIENSLIRLQPLPGPRGASPDGLGHAGFFKWHNWDNPETSLSPDLALHGNVFMAERAGQVSADRMGIPPGRLQSCANNIMVWLGPGNFPASLPACFTVTTDRAVWDSAVAGWIARHPDVGH